MNDIENILETALKIATLTKFRVRVYENEILYQELELSLMEISAKLSTNSNIINRIDIRLKKE